MHWRRREAETMNRTVKIILGVAGAGLLVAASIVGPDLWAYRQFGNELDRQAAAHQANGGPWPQMQDSCALCHGVNGQARNASYAALAGQPASYIEAQLRAFASGQRSNPIMAPLALELSDQKIRELSSYYARQPAQPNERPAANPALDALGKAKVASGNCAACHGEGLGGNSIGPRLAGQGEMYLADQLRAFRQGTRIDPTGAMKAAASPMTDQDVAAIAHYLAGLTPPAASGQ